MAADPQCLGTCSQEPHWICRMHWPVGVQGTAGTDRRRAHLHKHVVLGDEVAGHGVQAAAKHRASQQVHNRLEAAGVDHGGVKRHHDRNVDQVRRPCRGRAGSVSEQMPRKCTNSGTVSTSPGGTNTQGNPQQDSCCAQCKSTTPAGANLWTAQVRDGAPERGVCEQWDDSPTFLGRMTTGRMPYTRM